MELCKHQSESCPHPPMAYDRGLSDTIQTLTTAIITDIILTIQMIEIIDLLGGDSDSES